jgi:hypothetical protein
LVQILTCRLFAALTLGSLWCAVVCEMYVMMCGVRLWSSLQIDGSDGGSEPSHIQFERLSFSSRAVNIRYNDEVFSFNDCVLFRAEKVACRAVPCGAAATAPCGPLMTCLRV